MVPPIAWGSSMRVPVGGEEGFRYRELAIAIAIAIGSFAVAVGMMLGPSLGTATADQASGPLASLTAGKLPPGRGFHVRHERGGEADANVCSDAVSPGDAHCDAPHQDR